MKWYGHLFLWGCSLVLSAIISLLIFFLTVFLFVMPSWSLAKEPAIVKVIGVPSALRSESYYGDIRSPVYPIYDAEESQGSAVLVAPHRLITAAHGVSEKMSVFVNGTRVEAKLIRKHPTLDIAVVEANIECPCAAIASTMPAVDERVVIVGFPMFRATQTQISNEGKMQGMKGGELVMTGAVYFGYSGGGIFVRRGRWELVGIVTGFFGPKEYQAALLMLATPANIIDIN
jgi:trypsin-like peptidase